MSEMDQEEVAGMNNEKKAMISGDMVLMHAWCFKARISK